MKKVILVITGLVVVLCIGSIIIFFSLDNKKKDNNKVETPVQDEQPIIEEEKYVDDNPIIIGLYAKKDGYNFKLVDEYSNSWAFSNDIGVFTFFATHDDIPNGTGNQDTWWKYWNSYENADKYRIGYNIKYTTQDGIVVDENILCPADTDKVMHQVFVYLYDDVTIPAGVWHSHLEAGDENENTMYSSIKLTGNYATEYFTSPIELTAFTYKSDKDFDSDTGKYRGNSFHKVTIYQIK